MVAGMMSLIPIFGSILSSVPIVIVALVSGDQGVDMFRGVAMVLWIIGIHFIEANLLNPKIIGTAAKIHPVLVIFALFLGEAATAWSVRCSRCRCCRRSRWCSCTCIASAGRRPRCRRAAGRATADRAAGSAVAAD